MASQLMPGAANWIRRGNRNMLGGPPRATHHITWDQLGDDGRRIISLDGVSRYLLDVGYEPQVVIDPFTGEARQLLEAESSGYALENNGVQTNRRGRVNLQFEWFFTPGTVYAGRRYGALTDTPMLGLAEVLAWCDSWDIPRVAPLAPKDRNAEVWASTAGHYGHFNAPLNAHTDPIVSIASILAAGGPAPTPVPEGDLAMLTFRYVFDGLDWVFDGPSKLFFQLNDTRQITEVLDPLGIRALGPVSDVTHRRYSEVAASAGFSG